MSSWSWVHLRRDFGGVIFIVLRDRAGVVQVVVSADVSADARAAAAEVRSEYVIQVEEWFVAALSIK